MKKEIQKNESNEKFPLPAESIDISMSKAESELRVKQTYLEKIKGLTLEEHIFNWLLVRYKLDGIDYTAYISVKLILAQIEELAEKNGVVKIDTSMIDSETISSDSPTTYDDAKIGSEKCYFLYLSKLPLDNHLYYWFLVNKNTADIEWYSIMATHTVLNVCDIHAEELGAKKIERILIAENPINYFQNENKT